MEESTTFWKGIWTADVKHKVEWMKDIEKRCKNIERQADITVTQHDIKKQVKKTPNWNNSGPGVHGHRIKNFTILHERIAQQLNKRLETGDEPQWMTKQRTSLILKMKARGTL